MRAHTHTHLHIQPHVAYARLCVCVCVSESAAARPRHTLARIKTPSRDSVSVKRSSQKVKSQYNRRFPCKPRRAYDQKLHVLHALVCLDISRLCACVVGLCVRLAGIVVNGGSVCACRRYGAEYPRDHEKPCDQPITHERRDSRVLCIHDHVFPSCSAVCL